MWAEEALDALKKKKGDDNKRPVGLSTVGGLKKVLTLLKGCGKKRLYK